jgi:hypothetical protein
MREWKWQSERPCLAGDPQRMPSSLMCSQIGISIVASFVPLLRGLRPGLTVRGAGSAAEKRKMHSFRIFGINDLRLNSGKIFYNQPVATKSLNSGV